MPRALNAAQMRAVENLEEALRRCANAGIVLCGQDSDLLAYRKHDLETAERLQRESRHGLFEAQRELADYAYTVEDHGAYRDSGSS